MIEKVFEIRETLSFNKILNFYIRLRSKKNRFFIQLQRYLRISINLKKHLKKYKLNIKLYKI